MSDMPEGFEESQEKGRELLSRLLPMFREYSMGEALSVCMSMIGAIINSQGKQDREVLKIVTMEGLKLILSNEGPVKDARDAVNELNEFLNKHQGDKNE